MNATPQTSEFTFYEAGVGHLLHAAGCVPQSYGGSSSEWHVRFLDRAGEPVHLYGKPPFGRDSVLYDIRTAVVAWLAERGLKPTPEAVQRVCEMDRVAESTRHAATCAERLDELTRSVTALRASKVDDGSMRLWRFDEAPAELRALSTHGGDEDWLILAPPGVEIPWWLSEGSGFGCCSVSTHTLPDGSTVQIGAHA
jgi:hypothetical protein